MKFLLTTALLFTTAILFSQTSDLNLASDVWPPFTDVSSEHAFAIDLVDEALAREGIEMHSNILDFKEVMDGIRNKKFDGSAALWYSAERAEFLLFSEPYLENRLILVGKKGSNVDASSLTELTGKRIAIVGSYAYGSLLDESNTIELVKGNNDQENLERLLNGEADYMLVDALLIEYILEYQHEEADAYLEIGTTPLIKLPLYFAIRKDIPDAEKIIEKFNLEIKQMIVEGTYNRILQLNWVSTDVDGDGHPELVLNGEKAGTHAPQNSYMLMSSTDGNSEGSNSYVIDGVIYSEWDSVPDKYKVPPSDDFNIDKKGFGPVLKF